MSSSQHRYIGSGNQRGDSGNNNNNLYNQNVMTRQQQQQQQQHLSRKVDKYERFEAWLRDNGAKFEQLELREYDCGKSSAATCSGSVTTAAACEEKKETTGILDNDDEEDDDNGTMLDRFSTDHHHHHHHSEEHNHDHDRQEGEEESEMRGVHARSHIPPHTICMTIPRRCLITVEMGQATPIGQAILNSDLDLDAPKHIFLMIYLLWDKKINGRDSFFDPYYQILPQTLSNMPIFWTPSELRALKGSYLIHQIADRNCAIAEDYQAICSIAPLQQICTLDEFKWARMCVCSRNFGLQMDGHRTSALVPHADMLNHYRPRETKWTFDEDLQAFTITSLQHICPGSQVYDSYGQKCNHRFLLNYGFAVEDNRELDGFCPNEVPLELYVDPEDALFYEKMDFWTRGETSLSSSSQSVAAMAALHATNTMTASFLASHISSHISNNQYLQQQHQYPYHHHHESIENGMAQPPVVKRIRVCVSNNENTRLLFSLLRALACNAQELRAIRGGGSGGITLSPTAKSNENSSFFQHPASTTSALGALAAEAAHFRQYHNASLAAGHSAASLSLSSSPPSSSLSPLTSSSTAPYHRSCRDIRHPISIRNERAAMRLLLEIIGRHLSAYPTTLSQDVADLMDEEAFPRFSNIRHAKIQVRGEKQVLHHFALWARTALDVLDVIEEELKEERGSVEVKLTRTGRTITEERPGFEYIIRRMEDDCDRDHNNNYGLHHHQHNNNNGPVGNAGPPIHHTILRYCADVLGSLRREETKNIKRQRAAAMSHHHQQQQQQHNHHQHYHPHGGSPHRSNSTGSSTGSGHNNINNSMGQGSMQSTSQQQQQQLQQHRHYHHYNAASNNNPRGQPQQQEPSGHHHHSHSGGSSGDRGGSNRPYGSGGGGSPSSGYM